MAMKDYNSISFRNSAIDRMNGKFGKSDDGPGDKLKKQGQKMKAEGDALKAKGQAMKKKGEEMKKLGKASISPTANDALDEANTRLRASAIKAKETGAIFGKATATNGKGRTSEEQNILNKDMAIMRAKQAAAKIKAQKGN